MARAALWTDTGSEMGAASLLLAAFPHQLTGALCSYVHIDLPFAGQLKWIFKSAHLHFIFNLLTNKRIYSNSGNKGLK